MTGALAIPSGVDEALAREVARRRTFAIISHPDAGKTTLTEKLLLYGGAIELAGVGAAQGAAAPRAVGLDGDRAGARHLDHLDRAPVRVRRLPLQPARHAGPPGLQRGHLPHADRGRQRGDGARRRQGHRAADAASCSRSAAGAGCRSSPSSTSSTGRAATRSSCSTRSSACSGMAAVPLNWPIGDGPRLPAASTTSRPAQVLRFERTARGAARGAGARRRRSTTRRCAACSASGAARRCAEEVELLEVAGREFDLDAFRAGAADAGLLRQRAEQLRRRALPRRARRAGAAAAGRARAIAAGSSPRTRRSPASSSRSRRTWTRAPRPHGVPARRLRALREGHGGLSPAPGPRGAPAARPPPLRPGARDGRGGLPGRRGRAGQPGAVRDRRHRLRGRRRSSSPPLPRFPPEHFARLAPAATDQRKQFHKGLAQLEEEGAIQVLYADRRPRAASRSWPPSASCSSTSCSRASRASTASRPGSTG